MEPLTIRRSQQDQRPANCPCALPQSGMLLIIANLCFAYNECISKQAFISPAHVEVEITIV